MAEEISWKPCSVYEEGAGCVWLPRLVDKGRRALAGEQAGRDLLQPYLYGDGDYMDALLLKFLRTSGRKVLEVLRVEPDNVRAMAELARRSGRTPAECAAWSRDFLRWQAPFLA
ncbi:MAG: DUF5069 domain-containing protein, partial [Nevskia sp.]|nr:DUF5069 domain-containing protein [Nevskia sp.]